MKKSIIKNISLGIAWLLGVGGSIAATSILSNNKPFEEVRADGDVQYVARSWDGEKVVDTPSTCSSYITVGESTTSWTAGGWYVVSSDTTIGSRVTVAGTTTNPTNLILCDGATLTANGGISVNNGNTLNIYGQSGGSGSIIATSSSNSKNAGIGGDNDRACGTIFIHGGTITATCSNDTAAAGIGGGYCGDGGSITIYGGSITANGGKFTAAIGGGYARGAGTIAIYGGNVVANGGPQGAGLGCSADMGTNYPVGTITIHGGIINANGGLYAAGIGGGAFNEPAVTITINGGKIKANGGENAAGIGGGYSSSVGTITINGGNVVATGGGNGAYGIGNGSEATNDGTLIVNNDDLKVFGNDSETPIFPRDVKTATEYQSNGWKYMIVGKKINYRAWDGMSVTDVESGCLDYIVITEDSTNLTTGWYVVDSDITISTRITVTGEVSLILCDGKTLTAKQGINVSTGNILTIYGQSEDTGKIIATGPEEETCIGGNKDSDGGSINIQGGRIEANIHSGYYSTGIGGGYSKGFDSIEIYGGTVLATGSRFAPAIGSGAQHAATLNPGTITIYGGEVIADGGENAAAIGGGPYSFGESVTISGGSVMATGGANGSGIGIGNSGEGGTVTITGGYVTATGGSGGAGIGGQTISISGGHLNATGVGDNAAGIGSGNSASGPSVTISGGQVTATGVGDAAVGIGRAVAGGDHGTLSVTNGLPVYGGSSSESLSVKTDYATSRWKYMKVGNFHTHNFISYSASGNVITATCDNADEHCPLPNHQATLTISAPSGSLIYDGTAKEATYVDTSSGAAFSNITISYTKGGTPIVGSPIDAGTYVATISCNEGTASIEYTISKADASLTAPTAKTGLVYDGTAQVLINAGSATGGTIWYKLGTDGTYTESIPTATDAGTYNVYYKVIGDDNHNDIEGSGPIEVTISQGVASITNGTTVTYYNDFATALDNWDDGTTLSLYKDLDLSFEISVLSGSKTFNLNGYNITGDGNDHAIFFVNGGSLTVNGDGGKITNGRGHKIGDWSRGGAVSVYGGEATINDCDLTNNSCSFGGAVFVSIGNTTTLNNCNVYNNTTSGGFGIIGAIYVEDVGATVNVNGGEIYNNDAGIYLWGNDQNKSSKANLNGVNIHDNNNYGVRLDGNDNGNPALTISGNTIIKNNSKIASPALPGNLRINSANNAKFAVTSALGANASIGITMTGDKGVFTNNTEVSFNDVSKFYSDDTNYIVGKNADGQLLLGAPVDATYQVVNGRWVGGSTDPIVEEVASGGVPQNVPTGMIPDTGYNTGSWNNNPSSTINSNTTFTYTFGDYVASITNGGNVNCYTDFATALDNWDDGTTLTLYKDVETDSVTEVSGTKTLDLNGYGIIQKGNYRIFKVTSTGHLTIIDSDLTHVHAITLSSFRGTEVADGTGTTTVNDNGTGIAYITGGYLTGGNVISSADGLEGACLLIDGGSIDLYGGTIIGNYLSVTNCAGSGVGVINGGTFRMHDGTITYNYSSNSAAGIENISSYVEIYNGTISHNKNNNGGGAAISVTGTGSLKLYGGRIEGNTVKGAEGVVDLYRYDPKPAQYFGIKGSPVVQDNSTLASSGFAVNVRLYEKINIDGELTTGTKIGVSLNGSGNGSGWTNGSGVFTEGWSTVMGDAKPSDYFFSDNPNYSVYLKDGEAYLGVAGHTVTFNTNGRGIAPDPVLVNDGSLVNKPTDPTVEGYELKGWYKEAECENIWDFDNDTVTEDITLYASWDYDAATANVINLINDIGTLTYDGGSNDSLADILAAKTAYDALTPGRKVIVDGVNKDVLDHDITTYRNVDKVGDLINAIPEPSPDKSYYDAIDLAITEYNKLTEEEVTILNSVINYQKFLNDNKAARKVIIEIEEIGEVTYDGGINDSKKDIEKAEKSYNELSKDQKDIVDYVNHDVLVDDREIYDQMAKAIKAIKEIGKVENNEETKKKIEEARKIYDSLPEELKEFVEQYEDSLKVLEDDEKVLDVLVLIDDIGDVNYDSASQEKIQKARTYYDSLTEEQKRLIAPEVLEKLEEKEATYTSLNNTGNSLLIVFLIISGLLLILGLIVMYFIIRKKKEDNGDDNNNNSSNKSKTMKLASFTGLMPFIIYSSHYLDSGYILLYTIIALTVIVWLTNLVLFILKKKGIILNKKESKLEETKPVEQVKPVIAVKELEPVNEEEEEEVVTITDEKGNIFNIRYIKSFTAKLIQSPDETKKYYEELKNYVLSYKKTTSRISWHYDSINSGRNQVLKFAIRGKTLCVYYPLNAEDYNDTKYKVEAVESKKLEEVPCLYRIKNDRRLGYAKDLIDTVMKNLGLVKGEEQHEVYSDFPYEPNKPLIERGLIKELKIQVNKPAEEVVSKKVNDDGDEIVTTRDAKGNIFEIRYIKSFTAKLSQASEEVKDYYNELKNYALSYKKANSRVSWHFDSINVGRNQVIKFSIRGKTLCLYYALNANDYNDTKYKVEAVDSKKFEEVPCLYRIKNDRRRDYAKDLIDTVMASVPTEKGKESSEDFRIPYESTKALLAKGLIKENKVQVNKPVEDKPVEQVSEDEEEVITITDEKGNIFNIRYIKSFTAKLIQSPEETKKYYEELKNYVLSYKKTSSRISWHYDSINSGRNQVLKFAIRGKTLCLYYALNAEDYNDTKYKVEAVESKKFEEVPCLYRIKNDRRLGYAKDLIDTVMNNLGLEKGEEQHEVYSNLPYEPNAPLIARGLIKEQKVQVNKPVEEPVVTKVEEVVVVKAEEVDNKMSDEEATSKISENVESKRHHGKKGIINIDVIARDFNNNEVVNIEALWKKKIISTNIGYVKVLARGSLDKKLHFELQDYSLQAVKMILLTGGTVKRVK